MRKVVIVVIGIFMLISLFGIFFQYRSFEKLQRHHVSGKAVDSGTISLTIQRQSFFIDNPANTTYAIALGETPMIDLNVSPQFPINIWKFSLENLSSQTFLNNSEIFTPNISFKANLGANRLTVFANDSTGYEFNQSITFTVEYNQYPPEFGDIPLTSLACENQEFSMIVNASDLNNDPLNAFLAFPNPFFIFTPYIQDVPGFIEFEIGSGSILQKSNVQMYGPTVHVKDPSGLSDQQLIAIDVIGVNNAPRVTNVSSTTFDLYTQGENSSSILQLNASDTEDGLFSSGRLSFNITFLNGTPFFSINKTGGMNLTVNESHLGSYNVLVCTTDNRFENPHENITFCDPLGNVNKSACTQLRFTVTNQNRPPLVYSWEPIEQEIAINGSTTVSFNITTRDPDDPQGINPPDIRWSVNNVLKKVVTASSEDTFTYAFSCDTSGMQIVQVNITDGIMNDSFMWNVSVESVPCIPGVSGEGGGGGGGGGSGSKTTSTCSSKWACSDWNVCQNTENSVTAGLLSGIDYKTIADACQKNSLLDQQCGFQLRSCFDKSNCTNATSQKPEELQSCYFTLSPTCKDGIKNCHDGGCEFLIDCGGPCGECPTCSDGKQNQGELGIDCGNPCPNKCTGVLAIPSQNPEQTSEKKQYLLGIVVGILIIATIVKLFQIAKIRRDLLIAESKKQQKVRVQR